MEGATCVYRWKIIEFALAFVLAIGFSSFGIQRHHVWSVPVKSMNWNYNTMLKCGHFICIWVKDVKHFLQVPVLYFECSIHTSFVLTAEASSLFESSSGEGQAPTLPQAMLQHSFKLRTKADDPEQRQEGEVWMRSCMHIQYMCVPEKFRKWYFRSNRVRK